MGGLTKIQIDNSHHKVDNLSIETISLVLTTNY